MPILSARRGVPIGQGETDAAAFPATYTLPSGAQSPFQPPPVVWPVFPQQPQQQCPPPPQCAPCPPPGAACNCPGVIPGGGGTVDLPPRYGPPPTPPQSVPPDWRGSVAQPPIPAPSSSSSMSPVLWGLVIFFGVTMLRK